MKKSIWLMALLGGIAAMGVPVSGVAQRDCGTAGYVKMLEAQYPELAPLRKQAAKQAAENSMKLMANSVITIPVVVHIVFNNPGENITNEQVYSQIEVLNEDFRRLNTDYAITVPAEFVPFQPLAADAQIQFCLASVDPLGNPTSGITRTATAHGPFNYPTNDMMFGATGGIEVWNTTQYLNLYVCDIAGTIIGYAPYPFTAPASTDAVVIDVGTFGKRGTSSAPFDLGRTATHEIGHWLNLIHIFADDNPPTCTDSDGVGDTPNQLAANGGCPGVHISCSNGPNGDMSMNFMDYTDDACMYMFSAGQKTRMLATFLPGGGRDGLLASPGCGGACPRAIFLTDDITAATVDYQSQDVVVGWNHITGGSTVTYQAGDSVRLKPGFHAFAGNNFRAFINGCTGAPVVGPETENRGALSDALPLPGCVPNPFGDALQVSFFLPENAGVSLVLYDALGRPVLTQYQSMAMEAGAQNVSIATAQLPAGVYYLELRTPWQHFSRQLLHATR